MQTNYRLGLYEKAMPNTLDWPQKLAAAKAAGFNFVEISVDETDEKLTRLNMPAGERLALVEEMYRQGIHLETMCLSGHRKYPLGSQDAATRARSMEIMEQAILLCRDLGIRIIQLAGYDEYYNPSTETTREYFAQNLAASVEIAARYGVLLAFETMETPFLNTMEKAMYWVNQINSPYLMVYPDGGNLTNAAVAAGKNVLDDIATGEGHVAAFHLKETVPGKFREIPFGTGHVDFPAIIRAAWAMGVRRYTSEFWYVGQEDWQGTLAQANQFLRAQFAAALAKG